jgi:hypothetical protein
MRKLIDFNPYSKLKTYTVEEDGLNRIHYDQDVSAHLELAARCRNERDPNFDKHEHIHHVAFIPDSVILKMRFEDGVNFYDKADSKRVLQLIETKYPACKTTTKRIA